MIPAFFEGLAQAGLPCSWVVLLPTVLVGISTRRIGPLAVYVGSVVILTWTAVSGWLSPPIWVAGLSLLAGALTWWRWGPGGPQASMVGAGAAWAWQPCVGEELGKALNLAQQDPLGALPGLAAFMIGVTLLGLVLGEAIRFLLERRRLASPHWMVPGVIGALGLLMVSGLYARVASVMARWSTTIWG
jgi:hypothetical protein